MMSYLVAIVTDHLTITKLVSKCARGMKEQLLKTSGSYVLSSRKNLKRKLRWGVTAVLLPPPCQMEFLIGKLKSIIYLPKRAKGYLNLHFENLLFDALVKLIFEYCCLV